jgi:hypothetical protein
MLHCLFWAVLAVRYSKHSSQIGPRTGQLPRFLKEQNELVMVLHLHVRVRQWSPTWTEASLAHRRTARDPLRLLALLYDRNKLGHSRAMYL